jgi:hypothetical protein
VTGFQKRTPRGFGYSEFASTHREYPGPLEVQESSVATQRCLWIGSGEARAHLDEDRVRELLDLLTWWFGEDKEGDDDERSCSRCGDAVQILNSQDECMGCEEERDQQEQARLAIEADRLMPTLTPQRKAAIIRAAHHHHIWSYTPNSRYSGPWEPGKFHSRVIDWLKEKGIVVFEEGSMNSRISYGGGYALTAVGKVLAEWLER